MSFNNIGYEVLNGFISEHEIQKLRFALKEHKLKPLRGGIRGIDQLVPEVAALCVSSKLLSTAQQYLTGQPRFVRAIYFDKTPENNWLVTWHQDRTVIVSKRFDLAGWGPWSMKAGSWHVQPPLEVLENMITIRLNLDESTTENGCLKLIPASHQHGVIQASEINKHINDESPVYCETQTGSAIAMRPLIVHSSQKATVQKQRRVLHLEYSCYDLPEGVAWAMQ